MADLVAVRTGSVVTEGDELYYEVRGQGPALLLIAGGGGDAGFFALVGDLLADEYSVVTYDRRGNSRSTRNEPQNFEISQQGRDAVAVLRAVGEQSAFVCGNSGGAIIALELARQYPGVCKAVVVHEAPVLGVLPDRARWLRFFAWVHWLAFQFGPNIAMLRFALSTGIPRRGYAAIPRDFSRRIGANHAFFLRHEMLPFVGYRPDIAAIRENGVRIFLAVGATTLARRKYYGRATPILADLLGREMITFPGHHLSYFDMPQEWSATLRGVLRRATPPG